MRQRLRTVGLYARTLANLEPHQITCRLRRQATQRVIRAAPAPFAHRWLRGRAAHAGWPSDFTPFDARVSDPSTAEASAAGRFTFLTEKRTLGSSPDWEQTDAAHLWRFCLHDYHWAWAIGAHEDRAWARAAFADMWRSWRTHVPLGHPDGWSPYVASVRAWVWCALYNPLVAGTAHAEAFRRDLAMHAGYIGATLERDLGGNHLMKNLKALIGLGVFLDDSELVDKTLEGLVAELDVQVLPDGGHFELSSAYHCQVLGDLIDVAELLDAADRPVPEPLTDAIMHMRVWLGAMLMPDGDIPLFNDSVLQGTERIEILQPTPCAERLTVLEPSGYVIARFEDGTQLVCDVGPPGPPALPAHAHADCLSFELAIAGERVIVDTGTSTYEPGSVRQYERSTLAHNTVAVDGEDQTEVWGTFRAAQLANATLHDARVEGDEVLITGSHDGYTRLSGGVVHTRTFRLTPAELQVIDRVTGRRVHRLVARLHLSPAAAACPTTSGAEAVIGALKVSVHAHTPDGTAAPIELQPADVATVFGASQPGTATEISFNVALPHEWTSTVRWYQAPSRS